MAQSHKVSDAEKLKYISLYLELNPDEMQGYLLAAALKKRLGVDDAEVDSIIQRGITSERLSQGCVNLMNDMREALTSAGLSRTKAEIYIASNANQVDSLLLINAKILQSAGIHKLKNVIDPAAKSELLGKYANAVMSLNEMAHLTSSASQLFSHTYYIKLFEQADVDVDMGEGLGSSKAFSDKLKQEFKELLSLNKMFDEKIKLATPAQVDQYFEDKISIGEFNAKKRMLNIE